MPINIKKLFAGIKGNNTPCALVVVYGNRAFDGAMKNLHDVAMAAGFMPVAGVAAIAEHSLAPMIATSRPDNTDRVSLAEWGQRIVDFESNGMQLSVAPGEYPVWIRPEGMSLLPVTDLERCVECGICAQVCPTGAIPPERPSETDGSECIFCGACAKYCPEKARTIGNDIFMEFANPQLVEASKRKEAGLFHD